MREDKLDTQLVDKVLIDNNCLDHSTNQERTADGRAHGGLRALPDGIERVCVCMSWWMNVESTAQTRAEYRPVTPTNDESIPPRTEGAVGGLRGVDKLNVEDARNVHRDVVLGDGRLRGDGHGALAHVDAVGDTVHVRDGWLRVWD